MEDEFIENYVPPQKRSELTEVEELAQEIEFFSVESFKLGLRLGVEVFGAPDTTCSDEPNVRDFMEIAVAQSPSRD